jgi:hypothetical protein
MSIPQSPEPEKLSFLAYRNIYTIKTSQSLFDDLVDPEDFPVLQTWDNASSQIDHSAPALQRNFQYGNYAGTLFVFEQLNWRLGRFSDGSFGVWYGAKDEQTSIMEGLYWSYKINKEDIAQSKRPVIIDRKMFEADCDSARAVDLFKLPEISDQLTSEDYVFCQELGLHAVKEGIGMYLTPSARNSAGVCVPVFDSKVIRKDRMLYFCHFTFFPNGQVQITTDKDLQIEIPASWRT